MFARLMLTEHTCTLLGIAYNYQCCIACFGFKQDWTARDDVVPSADSGAVLGLAIEVARVTGMRFTAAVPTSATESTGPALSLKLGDTYRFFVFMAVG